MRFILLALACLGAGLMAFTVFSQHPAAHTASLLRPAYVLVCGLAAFAVRSWLWRGGFAALSLLVALVAFRAVGTGGSEGDLRVYSKNLWWANEEVETVVADIMDAAPDVVFLQEVSERNGAVLELLEETFPHHHLCGFSSWSKIAILSRTPLSGQACSDRRALALASIRHGNREVSVASVHIPWPWPYNAEEGFAAALDVLNTAKKPIVLGGDMNSFAWSRGVQRLAEVSGTRVATPIRPTLSLKGMPLPIDMVLAPTGRVAYRPLLGSDHRGVVADVSVN